MKKQVLSEQFLRMQKLAGILNEDQYRSMQQENEDKLDPGEIEKQAQLLLKDREFQKGINSMVAQMTPEDKAKILKTTGLNEAVAPSLSSIINLVASKNPANEQETEGLVDPKSFAGKVAKAIQFTTRINAVVGWIVTTPIIMDLLNIAPTRGETFATAAVTIAASAIIYAITKKLLGKDTTGIDDDDQDDSYGYKPGSQYPTIS